MSAGAKQYRLQTEGDVNLPPGTKVRAQAQEVADENQQRTRYLWRFAEMEREIALEKAKSRGQDRGR